MSRRRQPSSIDRLPPEIRELIGRLREEQGCTIDQIIDHLKALEYDISRSAMGRHLKNAAEIGEQLQHSRAVAVALVSRFGEEPDDRVARLNLELMQSVIMRTVTAMTESEDGEVRPVTFGPEEVMFLSKALKELSSARKADSDRMISIRRELAREAAQAVDRVAAREGGMSKETIAALKSEILGIGK